MMGAVTEVGDVAEGTGTALVPVTKIVRENLGYIVCAKHKETGEVVIIGPDTGRSGGFKTVGDVVDALTSESAEYVCEARDNVLSRFESNLPHNIEAGSVHIREIAADVDFRDVASDAMQIMRQRVALDKALTEAKSAKGGSRISSGAARKLWNALGAAPVNTMFAEADLADGHIVAGYKDAESGKPYYLSKDGSWPTAASNSLKANRFAGLETAGMALVGYKQEGQGVNDVPFLASVRFKVLDEVPAEEMDARIAADVGNKLPDEVRQIIVSIAPKAFVERIKLAA